MDFLSAAYFDSTVTVASKVQAQTTYVLPAVNTANTAFASGPFEAVIASGQYAAGARPGYGFHAAGSFGVYLYAQSGTELRIRSNSGVENTLWHSGNSRSDAQNDTRYSQLGHIHAIADVTNLQTALDSKLARGSFNVDWNTINTGAVAAFNTSGTNGPAGAAAYHGLFIPHGVTSTIGSIIAFRNGFAYWRSIESSVWGAWQKFASESFVTSQGYLTSASLTGYVQNTRQINTSAGILGGGPLSSDLNLTFDTTFGDARYSLASHTHTASQVTDFTVAARLVISGTNGIAYDNSTGIISPTYGTGANQIAQGNDSRITNGQTAFGWGNHASAGYLVASYTSLDWAGVNATGTFKVNTSSTNNPFGGATTVHGIWIPHSQGGSYGTTLAFRNGLGFWRSVEAGVWGTWQEFASKSYITSLGYATTASLSGYVPTSRTVSAGTGLSGGGPLSANISLAVSFGSAAGTVAEGNDSRITNGQTAFGWGNHAAAGYVPITRTITINGTTFDLSANRSWTVSGGLPGSGTTGFLSKWNGGTLDNASIEETSNSLDLKKAANIGKTGSNFYVYVGSSSNSGSFNLYNATGTNSYSFFRYNDDLAFTSVNGNTIFEVNGDNQIKFVNPTGAKPFTVNSQTLVPNLNADMVDGFHASDFVQNSSASVTNWNAAYGWGNHASAGYLSGAYSTADWNAVNTATVRINTSSTNGPAGAAIYHGLWIPHQSGTTYGTSLAFRNGSFYIKSIEAGAWGSWIKMASESYVTSQGYATTASLSGYVPTSRTVSAGTGLTGGGPLNANISLAVSYGTAAGTAAQGNDSRITNGQTAFSWGNHASAGYVPNSRTITINGTTYDLSANRSWTISGGGSTSLAGLSDVVISSPAPFESLVYISGMWRNYSLNPISGTGTAFKMAYWSNSSTLTASSIMTDLGFQISISGHLVVDSGMIGLPNFSSDPSSPGQGALYFNTSVNRPKFFNGSSWITL